ncbi:sugar ABC transporter permease [Ktedonosporobacter rubrisoli]|uniref:Sugar ABC transporter permease n=1 Tax=Ktedonosporobacter rubrisoli TaxID=2509675 RepID=A0A4P6K5R3_KTERU|nr:sugar ABC transporter permease [Ktedonosporobacter rubrisoli]QBD83708.1 sugar ABC transporter permease [Ktedonosporobacter rubrisoli]
MIADVEPKKPSEQVPEKRRARIYRDRLAHKEALWGYLLIAPLMLGLGIFYLWPVVQNFYFSFTLWGAFGTYRWIGGYNYLKLLHDPELWQAVGNTLLFALVIVPLGIASAICIAVLLNRKLRGVALYRLLYFLPVVTMSAAVALTWNWLYNGDYGLINTMLGSVGIRGPRWLADPDLALFSIMAVAIWSSIGHKIIIFLAGLQSIPRTFYEAAALDGAGVVRTFFSVTLPLLSPSIFFATVIGLIHALQIFDLIFLMAGSNVLLSEATQTVVYRFYKVTFILGEKGYGAAITIVLFLLILSITALQMWLQKGWVHYE